MVILQSLSSNITTTQQQQNTFGSKVDLLATALLDKDLHELSSCEWKRHEVADTTLFKQQGKNLRTNASILSKLVKMGCFSSTIAMDWSGK